MITKKINICIIIYICYVLRNIKMQQQAKKLKVKTTSQKKSFTILDLFYLLLHS